MERYIKIHLTKGKSTIVDWNMRHLKNYRWHHHGAGYAAHGLKQCEGGPGIVLLHHCIIGKPLGKLKIDHIDNNPLNNRRDNLRIVTNRENMSNQKKKKEGKYTSKFVGVSFNKRDKKWESSIEINNKSVCLGKFYIEIEASEKYQEALKKLPPHQLNDERAT